jgi:hypothetical protein
MSYSPWVARELEPSRKLFFDHSSSILHGACVGAGPFFPVNKTLFLLRRWGSGDGLGGHNNFGCEQQIVKL